MNIIKKTVTGLALAGALLYSSTPAQAEQPPVNGECARVVQDEGSPIHRSQIWIKDLPANSDVYGLWEHNNATDFYKFRMSALPFTYKSVQAGAVIQHVDGTQFEAHKDVGLALRVSGKLDSKTYAKIDVRNFPKEKTIDSHAFVTRGNLFLDCVSSYNHRTDGAMFIPGIDYVINKNVSVGLEGKFAGTIDDLQNAYAGMRIKLRF